MTINQTNNNAGNVINCNDKRYMVFAGNHYYPNGGFKDYLGSEDSPEDAIQLFLMKLKITKDDWDWYAYWLQIVDQQTETIYLDYDITYYHVSPCSPSDSYKGRLQTLLETEIQKIVEEKEVIEPEHKPEEPPPPSSFCWYE